MALVAVWLACAVAGIFYSRQYGIPWSVSLAVLPAFLIEAGFYTVLGVERWRQKVDRLAALPWWLTLAAVAPYIAVSLGLGSFEWRSLALLVALAALACFWYARLPHRPAVDVLFLVLLAAVVLSRVFQRIYIDPHPKAPLEVLGQLMWIRTAAFALLSVRRVKGVGFGFVPSGKECGIGVLYYLAFLPVGAALAWLVGFGAFHWPKMVWWQAAGTFLGMLWVVALGEEFFFRGLLQQWLARWLASEASGLAAASVLFGGVHLFFRTFPNWRMALLATAAGVCYGLAFRQAKSIRASMVTHALVATTWRVFYG